MNIGEALRLTRNKIPGLKQGRAAKEIGMSQNNLSCIENGHKKPTPKVLKRMLDYYKISMPVLIWYSIEEEDIPINKRNLFRILKPAIDSLINQLQNDK
jgi:transcriptional regulator with XRE-family HTH domain